MDILRYKKGAHKPVGVGTKPGVGHGVGHGLPVVNKVKKKLIKLVVIKDYESAFDAV